MKNVLATLKQVLATPLKWIRGLFFVLSKIPFIIVLLAFGVFGFVLNDQGADLMLAFGKLSIFHPYVLSFIALLIVWAGVLWYVARIVLTSANLRRIVDKEVSLRDSLSDPNCGKNCTLKEDHIAVLVDSRYRRSIQGIAKVIPRLLAALPYLIFIWAYLNVNGIRGGSFLQVLIVFLVGATHVTYLCFRTEIFKDKEQPIIPTDERFSVHEVTDAKQIITSQRLRNTTRYVIPAVFVGTFLYAWITARSVPSLDGKPGLIILCGLIFYTLVGLFMDLISNRLKFPFFSLLLILMLFVSLPRNNNHAILETPDKSAMTAMIQNRKQDTAYAAQWLSQKWKSNQLISKGDTIPVFIIAAEGGGVRACYWTAHVLKQLHIAHPEIYNNTFAVTGASGGTVGLSFFYNYLYQKNINANKDLLKDSSFYNGLDTICASDFLSGVTYGFLFPDLAQRAIPFPIASFDRAKFLNKGFSGVFNKHAITDGANSVLDQPLIAAWQTADAFNYPVILYNSLFVEQGQKAIFSPIKLSELYYRDVLDIFDTTKVMVPVTEGMVSSARFPLITPPGLMVTQSGKHQGHIVDGGYFENTAIQTAQQTSIMIKRIADRLDLGGKKVVPVLISMKYGSGIKQQGEALGWNYEIAPIQGGMNTLFRWVDAANAITLNLDSNLNSIDFRLPKYEGDNIPLGWYLSEPSRLLIKKYAAPNLIRAPLNKLEKYLLP